MLLKWHAPVVQALTMLCKLRTATAVSSDSRAVRCVEGVFQSIRSMQFSDQQNQASVSTFMVRHASVAIWFDSARFSMRPGVANKQHAAVRSPYSRITNQLWKSLNAVKLNSPQNYFTFLFSFGASDQGYTSNFKIEVPNVLAGELLQIPQRAQAVS